MTSHSLQETQNKAIKKKRNKTKQTKQKQSNEVRRNKELLSTWISTFTMQIISPIDYSYGNSNYRNIQEGFELCELNHPFICEIRFISRHTRQKKWKQSNYKSTGKASHLMSRNKGGWDSMLNVGFPLNHDK